MDKYGLAILDQTSLTIGSRKKVIDNIDYSTIDLIYVDTDFSLCFDRNSKRQEGKKVPDKVMERMKKSLQTATIEEGFTSIMTVRG